MRDNNVKDKNTNCSVNWPCSRSEIIEVIENVGSGQCKIKNKRKKYKGLWYKFVSIFHKSQLGKG